MERAGEARRLIEELRRTGREEYSEAARDEAQKLLLQRHLARLKDREAAGPLVGEGGRA